MAIYQVDSTPTASVATQVGDIIENSGSKMLYACPAATFSFANAKAIPPGGVSAIIVATAGVVTFSTTGTDTTQAKIIRGF